MDRKRSFPPLYIPFIWASFLAAVFGGFHLAAYLSLTLGSGWWSGALLFELVQLHGHLQLMGWMGMLLIGVSLYILPRLVNATFPVEKADRWIFSLLLTGILLRVCVPFSVRAFDQTGVRALLLLSSLFEAAGIIFYIYICFRLLLSTRVGGAGLKRLWPYFAAMFSGLVLIAIGQVWLSFAASGATSALWNQEWNGFLNDVFVRLVFVPAIFGFGVKMLPVFLGLTPPLWPVRNVGLVLLISSFTYISARGLGILEPEDQFIAVCKNVGLIGFSVSVLTFIWFLDALLFRVLPERVALKVHRSDVKEQRGRFGDKGEYGRFELFVVVGFAWLSVVAILEGTNAVRQLFGASELFSYPTLRHGLLLGALSHLVLGVSHRLLPKLLERKLVSPGLTIVSFWFLFIAALLRVVPPAFSDLGFSVPMGYFSWSGVAGLLAVTIAFINILGIRKGLR